MIDMRRTLLWVVFVMSLVLLWDAWNKHNGGPSLFGGTPKQAPAAATSAPGPAAALPAPVPSAQTATPAAATTTTDAAATGEQVTVTTDVYKATFDSRGGSLVRLELVKFADVHDSKHPVLLFDQSAQRAYSAQSGLIAAQAGVVLPNHLTVMTVLPAERTLSGSANELTVGFESPESGGVRLTKTYTFHRGDYAIGVRHMIRNVSATPVMPQLYLQLVRDGNVDPSGVFMAPTSFTGPAVYTDDKHYQKVEFTDIAKGKGDYLRSADNGYVAMVQHYFATAWLVHGKQTRNFALEPVQGATNLYRAAMVLPQGELAPGAAKTQDAVLFAGPQEETRLAALAPGLELVKDYGYFAILAKPLYWLLDHLHRLLGNWGWSIVALVVLLKIAFYWLNASAYRSMGKMKAINPKVMEMRERLKDKPQQMQQEMMRIYREEKVNPLGGCLPIVVQIPFFIALYWVLLSSVEMRNAPWIGWVHDLSIRDPYFILPALMTGSTLFQTWLNPTPPDPVQAKMMWIMPMVFSVMFFVFPAGLVLYWLTNNLLSIAQQWFINRQLGVSKSLSK
jgi:YidC/Oxa1 family membrane protein insertase